MRFGRLAGPGSVVLEDRPEPSPGAGEVTVTLAACGVCGTDLEKLRGNYLLSRLRELQKKYEEIGDVRGLGLMTATEFVKDRKTREPAIAFRDRVLVEAYKRGLILLPCGKSSIRYIPPLIVRPEEIDEAIEILDASLRTAHTAA